MCIMKSLVHAEKKVNQTYRWHVYNIADIIVDSSAMMTTRTQCGSTCGLTCGRRDGGAYAGEEL